MIDTSTWKDVRADVLDELHLDPRNVRLDGLTTSTDADIIQSLFHNEKVLKLAEGIAKAGYFTHEVPIVVMREGKLVVVEGNRRVAALATIQNPFLVPAYQAKIEKLASLIPNREALRRISVKQAPSEDEANQLIAALHTSNQRVNWTRARQAAFFQRLIDTGHDLKGLQEEYPTADVLEYVKRGSVLAIFKGIRFDNPDLEHFTASGRFPVSTLERLYEYQGFLDLAGLQFDANTGLFTLEGDEGRFHRLANRVLGDIKDKTIDTRVLSGPNAESYRNYMRGLEQYLEDPSGTGPQRDNGKRDESKNQEDSGEPRPSSKQETNSQQNGDEAPSGSDPRGNQSSTRLDTSDLIPLAGFPAIERLLKEIGTINYRTFPNASFDLLRTFLEKSIKAFAESINESIPRTNPSGFVYLSDCMNWLGQYVRSQKRTDLNSSD